MKDFDYYYDSSESFTCPIFSWLNSSKKWWTRSAVSNYPNSVEKQLIKDVDVFRPAFSEDKTISIRITIPGIGQVPVTAEVKLPVNVSSGYFE